MFPTLLSYSAIGVFLVRVVVGLVFFVHGRMKIKDKTEMSKKLGMSAGMVGMMGFVETISGLLLILGLWTQVAALLLSIIMIGALYFHITKWKHSFAGQGGSYEFPLLLLVCNLLILSSGAGAWALDSMVF